MYNMQLGRDDDAVPTGFFYGSLSRLALFPPKSNFSGRSP